ncbi:hypothetical protein NDU88_003219 [Pleurodeles waltl]|uniref:Uncharacterized protein n=1 Tax=Pleurodeles waltl TaxID=8319 RepID=A0AAV7MZI9_PLEWA|nr:hypothetical protein NDU88_003219 [Pleurodeles waltl]
MHTQDSSLHCTCACVTKCYMWVLGIFEILVATSGGANMPRCHIRMCSFKADSTQKAVLMKLPFEGTGISWQQLEDMVKKSVEYENCSSLHQQQVFWLTESLWHWFY